MADTESSTANAADEAHSTRPQKPDDEKHKADLAKADKDHDTAVARFNAVKSKLDGARPGKDSPANDRFKTLVEEQKSIRAKQSINKSSRTSQQEKSNANDAQIKALINEQKEARTRVGFKSVEEIERQQRQLRSEVDSGKMKIVDEKKALAEVSALEKRKKAFSGLDDLQKRIDQKKAENAELKKTFDNPESRALAQKYEDNQKELDDIKAGREDTNKSFDTLKAERDKAYADQQETYAAKRRINDEHYKAKRAYKEYEDMLFQQRREKQQAERDAYNKEKRKRIAEQKLEEASEPAFLTQIRTAENLIKYYDPSSVTAKEEKGPGEFAASAQRTVDESEFKGMKVVKKDEEEFFTGTGGKKKGKGKKSAPTGAGAPEGGKLNMNAVILDQLTIVGLDPPSTQAATPRLVEQLKEKLGKWKKDQDAETKKNVEKAQKEIDDLEKEAAQPPPAASSFHSKTNPRRREDRPKKEAPKKEAAGNGIADAPEKDTPTAATDEIRKDLKEVSLENKKNVDVDA